MEKKVLLKMTFAVIAGIALGVMAIPRFFSNGSTQWQLSDRVASSRSEDLRLRALEARLDRIDDVLAEIAGRPAVRANGNPGTSTPQERELSDRESAAAMESERQRQVNAYANAFHNQKLDPKWGLPKEALLLDKMGAEHILSIQASMPTSREIKCRSYMCQMKFSFSNAGDAIDWADAYVTDLGTSLDRAWYTYETRPDGSTEILMYGFK